LIEVNDMKNTNTYLVSADGWPTKYIRTAATAAEARRVYKAKTGCPLTPKVEQVCGKKSKSKGGE
jgi:hypothetical protein